MFYSLQQDDATRITSFAVYGTSLVILFLSSTLYHALVEPKTKCFFKRLEHCAIYLLIAGTYTPLMMITLSGSLGCSMLITVWLLAFAGIIYKVICASKYKVISVSSYLGL